MKFIKYLLFIFNLIFAVSIALKYLIFRSVLGKKITPTLSVCVCRKSLVAGQPWRVCHLPWLNVAFFFDIV